MRANDMPSVLLAAMSLGFGGAETHVVHLARELKRRRYPVAVASAGGALEDELAGAGVIHHRVPLDSRSPLELSRAHRRLAELLETGAFDLLHAHARIPAWLSYRLCAAHGMPLVTTYHGVYRASWPLRVVTRWGDGVIAVSEDVRRHLIENFALEPTRIRVIPNGVDTDRFHPDAPKEAVWPLCPGAEDALRIVHVSRLDDEFAEVASALIDALAHIRSDGKLALIIVGAGNRLGELRAAAASSAGGRAGVRVWVVGGQPRVEPFLAAGHLVVAVARTALEAMACRRPVVIAGEGGLVGALTLQNADRLAAANFTGRLDGDPVTPGQLANALQPLLDDAGLRQELGEFGRRLVVENYSVDQMVDGVEAVYAHLLAERSSAL